MKNILLVFTGGTIGSQSDNGTIDTNSQAGFKLIQLFRQHGSAAEDVAFQTLQPLQILSENLHPNAWKSIIAAIESSDLSQFDGIIVTHGTDTLAFSAAMLGIYFHDLTIPLLLVSSDMPLDNPQANGLKNFICAVDFIRQQPVSGVFVPYQNPGQGMRVHLGVRISSCLPLSSDFISAQSRYFMSYQNGCFQTMAMLDVRSGAHLSLRAEFARILIIRPFPGLDYDCFKLDGFDAVLHDLYHSGTACVDRQWGEQHSLLAFSRRCRQAGVPLYLAPALRSEDAYSSTREMLGHGAKMIWNTSLEAAYAKLVLACGNFDDIRQIDDFMEADIAGEQVESTKTSAIDY